MTILSIPGIDLACPGVDAHFVSGGRLDEKGYRHQFRQMDDLIFHAAISSGTQALIFTPLGCGAFGGSHKAK